MKSQQYKSSAKVKVLRSGNHLESLIIRRRTVFLLGFFFGVCVCVGGGTWQSNTKQCCWQETLPMKTSLTTKHLVLVLQCQESFQSPFGHGWDADWFARITQCIFGGVRGYFPNMPTAREKVLKLKAKSYKLTEKIRSHQSGARQYRLKLSSQSGQPVWEPEAWGRHDGWTWLTGLFFWAKNK